MLLVAYVLFIGFPLASVITRIFWYHSRSVTWKWTATRENEQQRQKNSQYHSESESPDHFFMVFFLVCQIISIRWQMLHTLPGPYNDVDRWCRSAWSLPPIVWHKGCIAHSVEYSLFKVVVSFLCPIKCCTCSYAALNWFSHATTIASKIKHVGFPLRSVAVTCIRIDVVVCKSSLWVVSLLSDVKPQLADAVLHAAPTKMVVVSFMYTMKGW